MVQSVREVPRSDQRGVHWPCLGVPPLWRADDSTYPRIREVGTVTLPVPVDVAALYKVRKGKVDIVNVPPLLVAYIDGVGAPPNAKFDDAIAALFAVSFTAKFASKAAHGDSPKVLPLASQWTMAKSRKEWQWTMLIPQLPPIDAKAIRAAAKVASAKKPNPALDLVKTKILREGTCVQSLHVGPYETIGTTIDAMLEDARARGYVPNGRYHEIYISDPNRTAPEKMRTICRMPVKRG